MLTPKTILITGASRGIGLAFCKAYVALGHKVIALCRAKSAELESLPLIIEEGVDVRDLNKLEEVQKRHSDKKLDILINNAAINIRVSLDELDYDAIREQFEVNTLGPLKVTKTFLPSLKEGAKVVMISSQTTVLQDAKGGRYGYRISKSGLNILSASLSKDLLPYKVSVGLYDPGYVKTAMIRGEGRLTPEESAHKLIKRIEELTLDTSGQFFDSDGLRIYC